MRKRLCRLSEKKAGRAFCYFSACFFEIGKGYFMEEEIFMRVNGVTDGLTFEIGH